MCFLDKVNDWEKIYDLPAHASTITDRNVPSNVDVQKRLNMFEKYAKRRSQSVHQTYEVILSNHVFKFTFMLKSQSYNQRPLHVSTSSPETHKPVTSNGGNLLKKASSSSKPVAKTRQSVVDQNHLHPHYAPSDRAPSARSMHSVRRIIQATQPSPPPESYLNAKRYVPAALPPGYRVSFRKYLFKFNVNLAVT